MQISNLFLILVLLGASFTSLISCAAKSSRYYSSVVQYLYPNEKEPVATPQMARLALPAKVGIAFVPETAGRPSGLTEKHKSDLLKEVSDHFRKYDFVRSIEIIPSGYMIPKGSFGNLDQLGTMFGVEIIALVSYDQNQFTDEGLASITYWTLIGAYLVPGEKNDTHTMVDAAVYDIKSRRLLFRAPGVSLIKSKSTLVNLSEQLRADSLTGFQEASRDLIKNLDEQLNLFKERVKAQPQEFQVVKKPGYTGGGSLDAVALGLLVIWAGLWLWGRGQKKTRGE